MLWVMPCPLVPPPITIQHDVIALPLLDLSISDGERMAIKVWNSRSDDAVQRHESKWLIIRPCSRTSDELRVDGVLQCELASIGGRRLVIDEHQPSALPDDQIQTHRERNDPAA